MRELLPIVTRKGQITIPAEISRAILTDIASDDHGVASHPEDDLILATALSAKADYLVTGERKLQELGNYQGVTIVSPREFLDVLQSQPPQ